MGTCQKRLEILYVAAVFRYQQVTMEQKMKAIDTAGRTKVCI